MSERPKEVDEDWLNFNEDEENYIYDIAETTLDRAALSLNGKTVFYL